MWTPPINESAELTGGASSYFFTLRSLPLVGGCLCSTNDLLWRAGCILQQHLTSTHDYSSGYNQRRLARIRQNNTYTLHHFLLNGSSCWYFYLVQSCIKGGLWIAHYTLQRYCTENLKKIFPERKLRGLSPNFYIHISVSDFFIPRICLPIWLQQNRSWEYI